MATIEDIPAPLSVNICEFLGDIKSLDALIRVSPNFSAAFEYDASRILETLMAKTLHESLVVLLRVHALLHARTPQAAAATIIYEDPVVSLKVLLSTATDPLPCFDISFHAAKATVQAFTQIHCLANAIITSKFNSLRTLRFEHLADIHFQYPYHGAQQCDPDACSYKIANLEPPSYVEEQRVMRALWQIKLFSDFALAEGFAWRPPESGTDGPSERENHPTDPQQATFDRLRDTLGEPEDTKWMRDEFDEVLDSLTNLYPKAAAVTRLAPPHSVLTISKLVSSVPISWDPPVSLPFPTPFLAPRRQEPAHLDWAAAGHNFFHRAISRWAHSPLKNADWTVLRKLGLGLWDAERMSETLELMNVAPQVRPPLNGTRYIVSVDQFLSTSNLLFTWRRLYLQLQGRAELKRKLSMDCENSIDTQASEDEKWLATPGRY